MTPNTLKHWKRENKNKNKNKKKKTKQNVWRLPETRSRTSFFSHFSTIFLLSTNESRRLLAEQTADLQLCDHHGNQAIHWAAGAGHLDVCRYLVALRVDPAEASERHQRRRPLHWAARNGHAEVCRWLLEENGEVDAETSGGDTAIMLAAWQARFRCVSRFFWP